MEGKRKETLLNNDKRYIWHPFTQMKDWAREDILIIEEGEGVIVRDIEGREYIDGVSSLWVNLHGHRKREINEAIIKQIKKISHSTLLGLSHIPAIDLAKGLVEITPEGLEKVFYSDNGSTACEVAIKMAFGYWSGRRRKYIALENGYHGDTLGAMSVGGVELFHRIYRPLLFDSFFAPSPYCYRCKFGKERESCQWECIKGLEEIMQRHHKEVAALILEPLVQAAGGMIVAPKGYLKKVRELCTEYDIPLIADEVATGFGRTGKMFACEHEKVSPDIMCLAKGITGGYLPLAATLTTEKVYHAFWGDYSEKKTFFHGHTYTGNPLASAAALANLKLFEKEKILRKLQPKIEILEKRLTEFSKLSQVGDVRQCGFMTGIELVKDKETKEPYPWGEKIGIKVILEARKRGVIIRPLGNVIVIMPPLSMSMLELNRLLDIIYESIKVVTGE